MLSKSKIIAYRQCPKRLWFSKHRPDLASSSSDADAAFRTGHEVGAIAQTLYGPGELIYDPSIDANFSPAIVRTAARSAATSGVLFEAAFRADDTLVLADVVRLSEAGASVIEVKSSVSVKDYQVEDAAVQAHIMRRAGMRIEKMQIAHINSQFIYPGGARHDGLLHEEDITDQVNALAESVSSWIRGAKTALLGPEPDIAPGRQCNKPFECPFHAHCNPPKGGYPVEDTPGLSATMVKTLRASGIDDARDIPTAMMDSADLQRFHRAIVTAEPQVNSEAIRPLRDLSYPRYYFDFETISLAVPIWPGTRPYQAIPFQWSLHVETAPGALAHHSFLDLSGQCPARDCMEKLIDAAGTHGPIIVYTSYERTILNSMARMFPDLASPLTTLVERLFDLHPLAKAGYYHRDMHGSWSIKAVLPTIAPELRYDALDGVKNGTQAQSAYLEAINVETTTARREKLRAELLTYCELDTLAMVAVASFLESQPH